MLPSDVTSFTYRESRRFHIINGYQNVPERFFYRKLDDMGFPGDVLNRSPSPL